MSNVIDKLNIIFPPFCQNEGFVIYLMLRRKWLVYHYPDEKEYFNRLFKSNENIIAKCVLSGEVINFKSKIELLKCNLSKKVNKIKTCRDGTIISYYDFFKKYPKGFSLVFTYEPKSLIKATKNLVVDLTKKLFEFEPQRDNWIISHIDKEWCRYVHKKARIISGDKYLLLDFDIKCKNKRELKNYYILFIEYIKTEFSELLNNITYSISTPSLGMHIILKIDENVQYNIFKNRQMFIDNVYYAIGIEPEILVRDFLTHVPLLNPNVEMLNMEE